MLQDSRKREAGELRIANPRRYDFGYDAADQLRSANLIDTVAQASVQQYDYDYDSGGNRTNGQIGSAITTSVPNNLNQLTSQSASGKMHFRGSVNEPSAVTVGGNLATVDVSGAFDGVADVTVGTNTVPVVATDASGNSRTNSYQVTVPSGTNRTLIYDLNGNLTNDTEKTYEWDAENRLVAINYTGTSDRSEFSYDGLSRRVKITEKTGTTVNSTKVFVWCGSQICEERDGGGATVTKRFFGEGEQRIGGSDAGNYYYSRDHLGSIREVTDSNGSLLVRYDYDPYGKSVVVDGNMSIDFGYTGLYFHAPSGLNLTLYRGYNPAQGRWISRDPIGEAGGVNLYGYVGNDPINWIDPFGLFERDVHEGAPGQTYGTYTWARDLGISDQAARVIGRANIGVDTMIPESSGAMPWSSKPFGRSRHFDIPLGGDDSRDAWAWGEMKYALDLWNSGECEAALEALGRGLHSIQDAFAHGDFDNDNNPWLYHGSAMDNWAGRPDLHGPVERATKGYLQYFMNSLRR